MDESYRETSSLTDRYQTTVPTAIRKALNVGKRDKLEYVVRRDGTVLLRRAERLRHEDKALEGFLALIERDIAQNPQNLVPLSARLQKRLDALVGDVAVNLGKKLRAKR